MTTHPEETGSKRDDWYGIKWGKPAYEEHDGFEIATIDGELDPGILITDKANGVEYSIDYVSVTSVTTEREVPEDFRLGMIAQFKTSDKRSFDIVLRTNTIRDATAEVLMILNTRPRLMAIVNAFRVDRQLLYAADLK